MRRIAQGLLAWSVWLAWLALAATPATAAGVPGTAAAAESVPALHGGIGEYTPELTLYQEAEGETDIAAVRAADEAGAFVRSRQAIPNQGYGAPAYWARFAVRNDSEIPRWIVSVAYPPLDRLDIYVVDSRGNVVLQEMAGDAVPFRARVVPHRYYVLPVDLPQGEVSTIYLRAESEGALALPLKLWTPERFVEREQTVMLLLGGYYGIMVILIVYNSVLAFSMRSKAYFFYVCINLFTLCLFATLNGVAYQYLWPDAVWWNNRAIVFFICLSHVAALLFTRNILQTKKHTPLVDRLFSAFIVLELANVAVLAVHYPLGLQLSIYSVVAIQLLMIAACIVGLMRGLQTAKFFLFGWGVFMATAMLSSLSDAGWLPMTWWMSNASQAGSAFQAVVLSWGLADHIQRMRKEKERALKEMHESRRLAETDELTGLNNRRSISQSFEAIAMGRPERDVSILLIDVDHFKTVNDTYGHEAGDQALRELGTLMRATFPRTDVLCRFGGEEFIVLLPDTAIEGARVAADRFIALVRKHVFGQAAGQPLYCTVSIGVTQWRGENESFMQVVRRADEALYSAKRGGRDQVVVAPRPGGVT